MSEVRKRRRPAACDLSSFFFFKFSPNSGVCQDATHIQGGSCPSQLAHSDTLKKYISLVILNPVKLAIKINHNEKTEVAILWPCAPGDTAMSSVQHYRLGCVTGVQRCDLGGNSSAFHGDANLFSTAAEPLFHPHQQCLNAPLMLPLSIIKTVPGPRRVSRVLTH